VGVLYQGFNEITLYGINRKNSQLRVEGSFQYSQYDYELKKTSAYLVGVRTNTRNSLIIYSIGDSEALIDNVVQKVF